LRVLVVGSGGREHALAWRLARDAASHNLHAAPGNPGIASLGACHPVGPADLSALAHLAEARAVDLTVVGPEAPLAAGIVDAFRSRGLRVFGPTRAAARLESSKVFAKTLMRRIGVPTAAFDVFDSPQEAIAHVRRQRRPLVVKADGLAAGKGVVVADGPREAEQAVVDIMVRRVHGAAGERIVVEERLCGREASVLAFVSGRRVTPLPPARDYKRALDGDRGPNTGGMGAVAPAAVSPDDLARVVDEVLEPVAAALVAEGCPYTGVLYAGVMLTADGPQVLEFNCRFGDPEAQVLLPLLEGDLGEAMLQTLDGRAPQLRWARGAAVCVVLAAGGYPGPHASGAPVRGIAAVPPGALVFHAGTAVRGGEIVAAGGRVLDVVATGATVEEARARAYAGVAAVAFEGMRFRRDIGAGAPIPARAAGGAPA